MRRGELKGFLQGARGHEPKSKNKIKIKYKRTALHFLSKQYGRPKGFINKAKKVKARVQDKGSRLTASDSW